MSFTIGCDPELVCFRNGAYTPAHNYFKSQSAFGCDGCESVAEIRGMHGENVIDLTAQIKIVLEYGHEKAPELEFYAGHYQADFAIGGHIHVSTTPTPEIIDAMDTVLYSLSNCIDDRGQRQKREKTGYGKRKAYRRKEYGFEYRTPGSWLLSPSTTLVTLTLAKLAVLGVQEDGLNFEQMKSRQHSLTFLKNLKNELKSIPDDCREGLKQLDMLLAQNPLNWNTNILPNWGIGVN
ncbi:MAG: hypothetical protein LWX56_00675 [Ignavibacteria bacterium]|nr:hypothetical protein [Ignavibacteria bacterium]